MVRVDLQFWLQDVGEKEAVAPEGRPDAEKDTDWVVPDVRMAVMMLVTEEPWVTDLAPPLEREKPKAVTQEPLEQTLSPVQALPQFCQLSVVV